MRTNRRPHPYLWITALLLALWLATVYLTTTVQADPEPPTSLSPVGAAIGRLPPPELPILEQPAEEPENELIEAALLAQASKLENVTVTYYCICQKCCGKAPDHPAYGITASGRRATPGVSVAVDPKRIPLGSDVLVDYGDGELRYYRADDTGGAIKGNHIDVCTASHEEALALGVTTATVYWIGQEDDHA